jgi:hypothetical protein
MATRRSSQLTIAMSRTFKRQTTWDTPLGASEMNMAFNATSRNYLTNEEGIEEIYDCTGEELFAELVVSRYVRLIIDFQVDPVMLAGWASFNYGAAASPSGGTNESQTITNTGDPATGGTLQARFTRNYETQLSAAIAYNANAAAWTAALEAMPNIGAGNVLCSGGPLPVAPIVVAFQGALANLDVGNLEIISALLPGTATVGVDETVPGVGRTHQINRIAGYTLPFTSMYVGMRGSNKQPVIFKNVVADVLRCRAARTDNRQNELITATVQLIGSGDLQKASAYTMPGCQNIDPQFFGSSWFKLNGSDLYQLGSSYADGGLPIMRSWEYYHENNASPKFDGAGIDVTRIERGDRRPSGFNFRVLGEQGDPIWELARQQKPRSVGSLDLRVGPANKNVRFISPQAIIKLDNPPLPFEGRDNESHIAVMGRPKTINGDNSTPTNVVATVEQNTAFLVAA